MSACDNKMPIENSLAKNQEEAHSTENDYFISAKKLRDIAGQVNIPQNEQKEVGHIPENAKPYVGRYQTKINCTDKIVYCENGSADIVLNLLPDGTAYRAIIHLGKVTFASNLQYRKDKWFYDENTHEIILERSNGVKFFYNVDSSGQLILNAKKVINGTEINRKFFESGNPEPLRDYVLKKEQSN